MNAEESVKEPRNVKVLTSLPNDMPMIHLGDIEFTDLTPKHLKTGQGRECVVTPSIPASGFVEMLISDELMDQDGKYRRIQASRVTTKSGIKCAISVGDTVIELRGILKIQ